jgi:hypothetical protein
MRVMREGCGCRGKFLIGGGLIERHVITSKVGDILGWMDQS